MKLENRTDSLKSRETEKEVFVDILLDASQSRMNSQEIISAGSLKKYSPESYARATSAGVWVSHKPDMAAGRAAILPAGGRCLADIT